MKQIAILVLLQICCGAPLKSQSAWFDESPMWINTLNGSLYGHGIEYCKITGDTLIGGVHSKIYQRKKVYDSGVITYRYRYVYQSGDSILTSDNGINFILMYDFSRQTGDTLSVTGIQPYKYRIESTGSINLNNTPIRYQKIRKIPANSSSTTVTTGLILEKIGAIEFRVATPGNPVPALEGTHFFLNEPNNLSTDGTDWWFCSYTNNQFSFDQPGENCADATPAGDSCVPNMLVKFVQGDSCVIPQSLTTGETLKACEAPSLFYFLVPGQIVPAKVILYPGCDSICHEGTPVKIECIQFGVSVTSEGRLRSEEIDVFPNPTREVINYTHFEHGNIHIFNAQGQSVMDISACPDHQINISQLNTGLFFVAFSNEKGMAVKKVVVEKE